MIDVNLQDVYNELEDTAFADGVPDVANWIRDILNKKYDVELNYDEELDELK